MKWGNGTQVRNDGSFEIEAIQTGTYRMQLNWDHSATPGLGELWGREPIVVAPGQDADNVLVQPVGRKEAGIDRL
jgi:hypothetical protein